MGRLRYRLLVRASSCSTPCVTRQNGDVARTHKAHFHGAGRPLDGVNVVEPGRQHKSILSRFRAIFRIREPIHYVHVFHSVKQERQLLRCERTLRENL